jgi:hypothetical protein
MSQMSPTAMVILPAMVGYAVYQQTRRHQVDGKTSPSSTPSSAWPWAA